MLRTGPFQAIIGVARREHLLPKLDGAYTIALRLRGSSGFEERPSALHVALCQFPPAVEIKGPARRESLQELDRALVRFVRMVVLAELPSNVPDATISPACLELDDRIVTLLGQELLVEPQRLLQQGTADGLHLRHLRQGVLPNFGQHLINGLTCLPEMSFRPSLLGQHLTPLAIGQDDPGGQADDGQEQDRQR